MDIYADRFEGFFSWVILLPPKLGSNHTLEYPCKVHTHTRPRPGSQTNIFGFFQLKAEKEFQRNKFCFSLPSDLWPISFVSVFSRKTHWR